MLRLGNTLFVVLIGVSFKNLIYKRKDLLLWLRRSLLALLVKWRLCKQAGIEQIFFYFKQAALKTIERKKAMIPLDERGLCA